MAKDQKRDDELAAFTDALLDDTQTEEGDRPPLAAGPPLADVVEILARTLGHRPPPARLRSRMRRCVAAEWPKPRPSLAERMRGLLSRPKYRWAWATAAALVVVAITAALILPTGIKETSGTIAGPIDAVTLVIILSLMVIAGVVAAWFFSRRR